MRMWKAVRSELESVVLKITPQYIPQSWGGAHEIIFALKDYDHVVRLYVELPCHPVPTPTYFFVTFIRLNYYCWWPDSAEMYKCRMG